MGEMASEGEEPSPIRIVVEAPEYLKRGVYANTLQVRFTDNDFVIDCAQVLPPESPEAAEAVRETGRIVVPAVARIVVPAHLMPRIIEALRGSLARYEQAVGPIPRPLTRGEDSDDTQS